jgi:hypothetical protein
MKNSITDERSNNRTAAINQVGVERQRYPDRREFNETPEEFVDAILDGTMRVSRGNLDVSQYQAPKRAPLKDELGGRSEKGRRSNKSFKDPLQNYLIRSLRRFELAKGMILAKKGWDAAKAEATNEPLRIEKILDSKNAPWFTVPRLTLPPSCTAGTRVYSRDLAIRTAAQANADVSTCSLCRKTIIDLDRDWRTYASWVEPNRARDEKYKGKSKFTSRRYCRSCHQSWIGSHKVRTINDGTMVGIKRLYLPHQAMLSAILSKLPSGCCGAVLRHVILARPPVMRTLDLINQVVLAKHYQYDVVRKAVRELVRGGLLDDSRGPDRQDIPVVVLSQRAIDEFRVETDCGRGKTAIFRLDLLQPAARKKTPDTLDAAFRDRKIRWVVGCTIIGDDEKEEVDSKSIDKAFAMADLGRANPYRDPDPDDGDDPNPVYEDPDSNGDTVDQEHFRSTILPPDILFETEENFGETHEPFATRLIGTSSHAANNWRPELESVPPAESCDVCGYGKRRPPFARSEACLGCLRSGSDHLIPTIYVPDAHLGGGVGRPSKEKRYA